MGGGTLGANTQTISKAKYAADERARQYKREKIDPQTRAAQHNIGQVSGDAMSSFEQGMEGVGDFVERNTRSLRPQSEGDQGSDTSEANYSSSGQTQTSSGKGKKANLSDKDKKKVQGASRKLTIKKK